MIILVALKKAYWLRLFRP